MRAVLGLWVWLLGAPALAQLDAGAPSALGGMDAGVVDVTIRSAATLDSKRRSAEAVTVVDLARAQVQSADLGEVLARTEGVVVRRGGGLGSDAQLSINGLYGPQIRTFIDGIPSNLLYPFDIASVPVQLVKQVEVYRGVVPIRLGTDALGGAINLVRPERAEHSGELSFQAGSFGTYRGLFAAGQRWRNGLYLDANAFMDRARNDYPMNTEAPDASGRPVPVRVRRLHDRYHAEGGGLEVGVRDQRWAKLLSVRGYGSANARQVQHDLRVNTPDGEGELSGQTGGVVARYQVALAPELDLDVLSVYARNRTERSDLNQWNYDWFARRVGPAVGLRPVDNLFLQHDSYSRVGVRWSVTPHHTLRVSTTPSVTFYTGENRTRLAGSADALGGTQRLLTWISGAEYVLDIAGLENITFIKSYSYRLDGTELVPGNMWRDFTTQLRHVGGGDAVRYAFTRWFYAKASYEYATRMPTPGEVFGDGLFVLRNLHLEPERSHNLNVGPTLDLKRTPLGDLRVELNGFVRQTRDQIVAIPVDNIAYGNLANARSAGVDSVLHWSSPGRWIAIDNTTTYVDSRNTSSRGAFARFEGERIPNRPWLLTSWSGYGRWAYCSHARLEPYYYGRYVHSYYNGWENIGRGGDKFVIPRQITHTLGLSHILELRDVKVTASFEVQNLGNAAVYDQFRVPRPTRGYYFRLSASR